MNNIRTYNFETFSQSSSQVDTTSRVLNRLDTPDKPTTSSIKTILALDHHLTNTAQPPSIMATNATIPDDIQQQSPFMRLPSEIRLHIYTLVLQTTIKEIAALPNHIFSATHSRPKSLPTRGALALLHVNRTIRRESSDHMKDLARSKIGRFWAHEKACWAEANRLDLVTTKLKAAIGRLDILTDVTERIEIVYIKSCIGWNEWIANLRHY